MLASKIIDPSGPSLILIGVVCAIILWIGISLTVHRIWDCPECCKRGIRRRTVHTPGPEGTVGTELICDHCNWRQIIED